jgi:hypothetical protein
MSTPRSSSRRPPRVIGNPKPLTRLLVSPAPPPAPSSFSSANCTGKTPLRAVLRSELTTSRAFRDAGGIYRTAVTLQERGSLTDPPKRCAARLSRAAAWPRDARSDDCPLDLAAFGEGAGPAAGKGQLFVESGQRAACSAISRTFL